MKKIIISCLFFIAIQYCYCQSLEQHKKTDAEVQTKEGICLFVFSKPLKEYQYLGSIKQKVFWTGQPQEMISIMLKKVKQQYPEADGIIFTDAYMNEVDAIKFK